DKWLSFRNHNKKERLPFVVYADVECILEKKTSDENISRFTYQHHRVFSVGYYIRCVYDETMSVYRSRRGEDCVSWFVNELYDLAHRAKTIFDKNVTMTGLTSDEWEKFRDATHCHICERPTSLEKLVSYLDKSKLTITRSEFLNLNTKDFDLLTRKGVFPYEYVDSHATNVWRRFCIFESLPYGEFQWVDDVERFDPMSVSSDSVIGYILEVDLAYPQVEMRKLEVKLNKPIYVGICILEISKMRLYEFHPSVNTKIPGLMKDENNGAITTEVGLRAKMYALRVIGRSDTKRIKGVKKNVVAKTITFDDYMRCLNDIMEQLRRQSCIRSTLHEVYTVSELKLALSPYDDKRYVVPDSVTTLPWGHYKVPL
ncbi:hypothetical protein ALC60_06444, partial [Trachymyrmex zeteki]